MTYNFLYFFCSPFIFLIEDNPQRHLGKGLRNINKNFKCTKRYQTIMNLAEDGNRNYLC